MIGFSGQSKTWALALLLPVLSSCVEAGPGPGGGPPPRPWPEPRPQMCTMEYRPVCGERGGRLETFGNACQARERGFRIVGTGECSRRPDRPDWDRPGRPGRPDRPDWDRPGRPDGGRACTREYNPVCGRIGPTLQTFPNACEARNAGARSVTPGECRR
ncbi:Kazal-type serine protease inhibitor family protein [Neorhizobium alkalisoli]|uniref:Kazal-type serine protease inhibitor family protein n=1 Tax=Neorhizobium alkalisoli TaxID=528178 RepID=UPI000CF84DAE|nr:Kazal-type serine protease inhibitor [Neorhizobium alkalisoli]